MFVTQIWTHVRDQPEAKHPAPARTSTPAPTDVFRSDLELDKVTVLAVLASAAILAPLGVALLKQAAQIFAH